MKTKTSALAMMFSLGLGLVAHGALIAHYKLDEAVGSNTVEDAVANAGTATRAGVPILGESSVTAGTYGPIVVSAGTAASFGTAAELNNPSAGNYAITGNPSVINNLINESSGNGVGQMTVAAWINPDVITGTHVIAAAGTGSNGWKFAINSSKLRFTAFGVLDGTRSSTDLLTNTWQYVAMTYNNGSVEYFVNGVSQGTATVSGYKEETGADTKFGGRAGGTENFDGHMDEVKYFDTVLTAAEIQAAAIPEPSSSALLGLGALILILRRAK